MVPAIRACVFCSAGHPQVKGLPEQVAAFAQGLKARSGRLVYGGGSSGLMGQFADACLRQGLSVWGGITHKLNSDTEVGHKGIEKLVVVSDLFERKRWFFDQSDIFFVYPGGFGTLDEALEVLTWQGLKETNKDLIFVDLDGFWLKLKELFLDLKGRGVLRTGWPDAIHFVQSSEHAWTLADELIAARQSRNPKVHFTQQATGSLAQLEAST